MHPPRRLRRRSLFFAPFLVGAAFLGIAALRSRSQTLETDTTREIAPGLTLRSVATQTPQGPLRYWLVKAAPDKFDLGLQIPDETDAQKKRSVRALAAQSGAIVAVNGGFFAYGGAAVGAVKADGKWQRLAWKSRTALGWSNTGETTPPHEGRGWIVPDLPQIGPLSGYCDLAITGGNSPWRSEQAALNGFTLPGQRAEIINGFSVLTSQFARKYTLRNGEIAFSKGAKPIQSGDVDLQSGSFWVIARGNATRGINLENPPSFAFAVRTSPIGFDAYPHILGAGPRLIERGAIKTTEVEEEFRPDVVARGPRTCIGWDAAHNWLFLVADGRSASSVGLTLPETAQLFGRLGAVEAMNLDGGSSTQLVVSGELLNTPSGFDPVNPLRPREVQVINALVLKARGK